LSYLISEISEIHFVSIQLNSTFRLQAKHMHGTTPWSMIGVSLVDPIVIIGKKR